MPTMTTETLSVTIDARFDDVFADLANPVTHPEWATEFFAGPATPGERPGEAVATVPAMGGPVRIRIDADPTCGRIDMGLAPGDAPFGPPLPIRLIRNGDGVDVLFTLARTPGQTSEAWEAGLDGMKRELENLRARHETAGGGETSGPQD